MRRTNCRRRLKLPLPPGHDFRSGLNLTVPHRVLLQVAQLVLLERVKNSRRASLPNQGLRPPPPLKAENCSTALVAPTGLPFPMRSLCVCVCAWSLENNARNKGEVVAAVAFSSGVRPSEAAGVTKKVSHVVARGLTSDSRVHSTPALFCSSFLFLPSFRFSTLSGVSFPLPSFPEYRTRTLAWTETVKTS